MKPIALLRFLSACFAGLVQLQLSAGVATDTAGNTNSLSTLPATLGITFSSSYPVIVVRVAAGQRDPTNGAIVFNLTSTEQLFNLDPTAITPVAQSGLVATGQARARVSDFGAFILVNVTGLSGSGGQVTIAIGSTFAQDSRHVANAPAPASTNPTVYFGLRALLCSMF